MTDEVFLGRSVTQHKQVSDDTAHAIDEEVRTIIDSNYQRAKKFLEENVEKLHMMANALIKYETIERPADPRHHGGPRAATARGLGRTPLARLRRAGKARPEPDAPGSIGGPAVEN